MSTHSQVFPLLPRTVLVVQRLNDEHVSQALLGTIPFLKSIAKAQGRGGDDLAIS